MTVASAGGPLEALGRDADICFRIGRPQVIDELINGELVVIHFDTGSYHGIRGSGVNVWSLLDAGYSLRELLAELRLRHGEVVDVATIGAFVAELERQRLIVPIPAEEARPARGTVPADHAPFARPVIESRDDLKDYLALDPIHDIDEHGWPRASE